ncbi:MAG TPA: FtsH protease activity modulator HflK [Myxococcota bacterium]
MADGEGKLPAEEKVRRSVARTLGTGALALAVLALLGVWGYFGLYTLQPGQAAVLLRLGKHAGTVSDEGLHLTWPPPIVVREIVNVSEVRNEDFGFRGREDADTPRDELLAATMQTSDNNIVRVPFSVQYAVKDAFAYRFRIVDPVSVARDAAQAAMREAVGRMTVDGVLRERREALASEVRVLLQDILDAYDSGIEIQGVQLGDVQVPAPVRAAFDDVVAATQDANRLVNEAEGYQNQVIPQARAQATELQEQAYGYRDAKIAQATGESQRFSALAAEHRKAPEVTRKRLYLETLEQVLPAVETVIVEPGAASVLPHLPLGRREGGSLQ